VDQHGHVPLRRELEDRRQALVVEEELLRTRMQLDAACPQVEAPRCLADRVLAEVEADERDHSSAGARPVGERPVVAGAEARVAVRLVEAEHEAAGDSVLVHPALEVLVDAHHSVDVGAEMRVCIEDLSVVRELAPELLIPLRHQPLGTLQRVVHALECMGA
jgi:hypothetical protein